MATEVHEPKISVTEVVKSFGDKRVLDGVDLEVMPGESVVVVGGSGAGKTVLLKHMIGLLQPDSGRVVMDGVDLTAASPQAALEVRKRCGMSFQEGALFDSMTVFDNRLPIRHRDVGPARRGAVRSASAGPPGGARASRRPSCRAACGGGRLRGDRVELSPAVRRADHGARPDHHRGHCDCHRPPSPGGSPGDDHPRHDFAFRVADRIAMIRRGRSRRSGSRRRSRLAGLRQAFLTARSPGRGGGMTPPPRSACSCWSRWSFSRPSRSRTSDRQGRQPG
jgi:hypothetical protein